MSDKDTGKTLRFRRHISQTNTVNVKNMHPHRDPNPPGASPMHSVGPTYYCILNNMDVQYNIFGLKWKKLMKLLSHSCCKALQTSLKESIL